MTKDITDLHDIRLLVDTFYERAAGDELLGPIFSQIAHADRNKELFYQYWCNELFGHSSDNHITFPTHIGSMFSNQHFTRWTTLFLETIHSLYSGPTAERAKWMVIKKSEEFQLRLEFTRF